MSDEPTIEEKAAAGAAYSQKQQEDFAKSQESYKPEQIGDPAYYTPLTEDQIRAKGGYYLMDETWNPGGPWDGGPVEGMDQRESNRVAAIENMLEQGTCFAWTDPYLDDPHHVATSGTPVGWFGPDEQGRVLLEAHDDDTREFAIEHGNSIVAGVMDPTYTVPGV